MAKSLVIVESPAKAKTINKYLGKNYIVKASLGHIKDLPKTRPRGGCRQRLQSEVRSHRRQEEAHPGAQDAAKKVDNVYLAADPDREGEAICWHLQEELKSKKGSRRPEVLPGHVQRNHEELDPEGLRKTRHGERTSWWTPSRPAAFWTVWWATRFPRFSGIRFAAAFRRPRADRCGARHCRT